ncbi:MAG: hypothetical protein JWM14_580 [Chitinophagaceae bacterium]|nr:hypothetical protein [Chitinophagaceae bacterium]
MATNYNFQSSITVKTSAGEVLQKISQLQGWWGVQFSGHAEKQSDTFTVTMGADSFFHFTVTELISNKRLVWLVTDCNMPWYENKKEWANTKLIFDLTESDGTTIVNFTHEGLTPDVQCYKDCAPGWTHWIETSLFSYLTTGKGVFREPTI